MSLQAVTRASVRGALLACALLVPMLFAPALLARAGAASPAGVAIVRAAHLSPDTPAVDAFLKPAVGDPRPVGSAMSYGDVGGYARVPAGQYRVLLVAHGAAATAKPLLSWPARLRAGHAYTLAGAGIGSGRHGTVIEDDLTAPAAHRARVRLIQAASSAGRVTLRALGGPVLASAQPFGSSGGYTEVPAGTWPVRATSRAPADRQSVTVRRGAVYSIVLLDVRGGGVTMRLLLDAAGAGRMPGAADTGGGGTAAPADPAPVPGYLWAVAALVVIGSVATAANRARRQVR